MNATIAVTLWLSFVTVCVVVGAVMGLSVTAGTMTFLAALCIIPPGVMVMVWRGAPPPTAAEVLNAAEHRR
jgi:hypothetical protein